MFATLLVAAATAPAAPIPADAHAAPAGPAPWVVHLKSDDANQLRLLVQTPATVKQTRQMVKQVNGKQVVEQQVVDVQTVQHTQVSLADLSGTVAAADGSPVGSAELLRRAKDGVTVLISADGKAVDRAWLKAVGSNTVVVAAKALAGAAAAPQPINSTRGVANTPAPRLTLLTTGPDGTVRVSTQPGGVRYYTSGRMVIMNGAPLMLDDVGYAMPNGGGAQQVRPLNEVGFDAYDLTGRIVARDEAVRRLRAGGLVLVAPGRFPDPAHLQPFRGDLLVLVSSENLSAAGAAPATPAPAPAVEVKPAILRVAPLVAPAQLARPVLRAVPAQPPQP
ncbi:hypothetical protein [Urbifossiella limnaea]|uniref:Uncharacterized protein n=1 Tax=Urbifossiella limnaea TaxID=2528023 RepID=A0A517XPH7_9BACT|nr:hypothetical protein [Urbifossiella limnaea]QDU19396.1 hypothetical protein ETAA1_13200 [Urbifossiella limnaea]